MDNTSLALLGGGSHVVSRGPRRGATLTQHAPLEVRRVPRAKARPVRGPVLGRYGRPAGTHLSSFLFYQLSVCLSVCQSVAEAGGRPELALTLVGRVKAGGRVGRSLWANPNPSPNPNPDRHGGAPVGRDLRATVGADDGVGRLLRPITEDVLKLGARGRARVARTQGGGL